MRGPWQRRAPPWWPDDEPWPPRHGPPWKRGRHFFLFRLAALLAAVLALSVYGSVTLFRAVAGGSAPGRPMWLIAFVLVVFVLVITMRRVGRPLGDVVDAAERVASGDFGVRVAEHGPPWLRSVAAAFNSMTERLEMQRQQRRDLMADIAHELRTPLSVMQGRLEGMLDGVYPRDEHQVARVLEETRLLSRLVDDLRTLAHSEGGTLALQKEPTDLGGLVDEVVAAFRPGAEGRGVAVIARVPADMPLVDVDPLRIREVVTNLLSNAVSYSPKGSTAWVEAEVQQDAVVLRVRDNGPGLSAEELSHIFARFYKGAASSGSGLGLTIARSLVVAHGGSIVAESRPGAGMTMVVTLPRRPGSPATT
jgi:signal transduction histidine kinase